MLKHGNGKLENCVRNLILLRRGEVQIDYLHGMRAEYADMPSVSVLPDAAVGGQREELNKLLHEKLPKEKCGKI